jgi:hypothetical protein
VPDRAAPQRRRQRIGLWAREGRQHGTPPDDEFVDARDVPAVETRKGLARPIEEAGLLLDLDLVESCAVSGTGLFVRRAADHLEQEEFGHFDVGRLGPQPRHQSRQVGGRARQPRRLLQGLGRLLRLQQIEEVVEAQVEPVAPFAWMVGDAALEQPDPLAHVLLARGQPHGRKAIGMIDPRIECGHHVDEPCEVAHGPGGHRFSAAADLHGLQPVVVGKQRIEAEREHLGQSWIGDEGFAAPGLRLRRDACMDETGCPDHGRQGQDRQPLAHHEEPPLAVLSRSIARHAARAPAAGCLRTCRWPARARRC